MSRLPRPLLAFLVAVLGLRLAIAARLPLGDDEAYYWDWSRHLAAGYVDHPPAIAFLVWAARHLVPSPQLAVHGAAAAVSFVTSLAVYALAYDVLGRRDGAAWSAILFNVVPVFAGGGLFAAPDGPLGLCWVLALLWSWRAAHSDRIAPWLAAGAWTGLALESKYTGALLPPSIALWLILDPARRGWWRRSGPWLAAAVALAVFAPVVWWNAAHGWISFSTTLVRLPGWGARGNLPLYTALEFVYLGPLMFPVLLGSLIAAAYRGLAGDDRWLFLAASGLPIIIAVFLVSALGEAKGHWAAPGYVAGVIALAGLAVERPWSDRSRAWRGGAAVVLGTTALCTLLIYAVPLLGPWLLPPRLDPTVDYYGWPEAARAIAATARRGTHRSYFFTTDRYQVLAQFDLATGGSDPATTMIDSDQYHLWISWAALRDRDALFIRDGRYPLAVDPAQGCRSVEPAPPVKIVRRGVVVRTLGLFWCRGFLGHPVPLLPERPPVAGSLGTRQRPTR
jgi:4-amino-4-deoxy-L-arabinose transferase-like glycosyltransferase